MHNQGAYTAGSVVMVITERWNGNSFYLKAQITCDADEVARSFVSMHGTHEKTASTLPNSVVTDNSNEAQDSQAAETDKPAIISPEVQNLLVEKSGEKANATFDLIATKGRKRRTSM